MSLARRCAALAAGAALVLPLVVAAALAFMPAAALRWRQHGARPAWQLVLPLHSDTRGLTRFAAAVSTPGSPRYGDYASVAWLARHFGARSAIRRRVVSYLREHGADDVSVDATGQLVEARMAVAAAERLFRTTLVSAPGRDAHAALAVRPGQPRSRLPRGLRRLVTGVIGLDTASLASDTLPPSSGYSGPDPGATPSGCPDGTAAGGFTPNEYLDAYQFTPLQQQGLEGQGERVALIEIDGFQMSDLETFANCFHLHHPRACERSRPVGVGKPLPAGGESTLDLEVLDAAAPDLKAIDVYETGVRTRPMC